MTKPTEIHVSIRILTGVFGTALVLSSQMVRYQLLLDVERTEPDNPELIVGMAIYAICILVLNVVYMACRKETEPLHLVLSSALIPVLFIGVIPGYAEIFFFGGQR